MGLIDLFSLFSLSKGLESVYLLDGSILFFVLSRCGLDFIILNQLILVMDMFGLVLSHSSLRPWTLHIENDAWWLYITLYLIR